MLDKNPTAESASSGPNVGDGQTGQTGQASESGVAKATPDGGDGTPAILKMFKDQSNVSRSFYVASMQKGGVTGGRAMGSTMSSTILKSGGGGVPLLGGRRRTAKPKWMVGEVAIFTLMTSELVQERNIISATLGINHIALLTGMLSWLMVYCHGFTGVLSWLLVCCHGYLM